jgi:CheY-like chemotaxis protein
VPFHSTRSRLASFANRSAKEILPRPSSPESHARSCTDILHIRAAWSVRLLRRRAVVCRQLQIGGRWRIKKSSLDRDILRQDKEGQPRVLVVDDDPVLQDLFQTFLKKIGFSRVVVGTAKEAVKCLRKQKFDLMFLDLQLPDAPGDQVYQTAKQIDPDLNVIVITGYPDSEILDRILQVCPVTVLKKPLKIEQLYQTVKILGHNRPSRGLEQQSSRLFVGL